MCIKCPLCKKDMENKGNISGMVFLSYPEQWDEVYVCETCHTKKTIRVYGQTKEPLDYSGFTEI
jgi:transposase-like protein